MSEYIGSVQHYNDMAAELSNKLARLKQRLNIPELLRQASAAYGGELKLVVFADGSARLRSAYANSGVATSNEWDNLQFLVDFIERHKTPALLEQLHDGAMVRLRSGEECKIRKRGSGWACGLMIWESDGSRGPGEDLFDIVEVLS